MAGGAAVSVRVYKEPINLYIKQGRRDLSILYGRDTVLVYDAWASGTAKVLNQQFLQLDYPVRGGSNVGLGSTLVLCVAKGRLCQVLKLPTYSQSDLYDPDEHELYQVRLRLAGTTPQTYQFHLTTHEKRRSERAPKTNHTSTTQAVLKFDTGRHLFYTGFKRVPALLRVVDDKTERVVMLKVTEPVPVVEWHNYRQYFIQGNWYGAARTGK
jgi:hypothetical protein